MNYSFKNKYITLLVYIFDSFGSLFSLPFKFFYRNLPKNIKNILIIRLDHIGDVIITTPLIENVKKNFPQANITLLAGTWAKDIIENNPHISQTIYFDAVWFSRKNKKIIELKDFLNLAKKLKKMDFDLAFDPRGDIRHILLMSLANVKYKVGFGITGGGFLLNKKVEYKPISARDNCLNLLKSLDLKISAFSPQIFINKNAQTQIYKILKNYDIKETDKLVIIHTQAGNSSKNWPAKKFSQLINEIYNQYKAKIILIGSEKDRLINSEIIISSKVSAINLAGELSLQELYALINKSFCFIGLDSAPSHIAGLTGKPAIILFSATNKIAEWLPESENVKAIHREVPCANCQKIECCDNICMKLIEVDDVLKILDEVLK